MHAFIALLAATASPAASQTHTATVRTADLDLTSPAGAAVLARRVAAAKEAVCGSYAGARDDEELRITACRAEIARQIDARRARVAAR